MNTQGSRLPEALARAMAARGFTSLTEVQAAVLAPAAAGRDLLVSAPTGSGKTIALGLALAPLLLGPGPAPRALAVAPTRELARQVAEELARLYAGTPVRVMLCAGGADRRAERRALAARCDLVVGSPGRLADHLASGALDLAGIAALALDEADDMLDLGFRPALDALRAAAPPDRRMLMLSATLGPKAVALAGDWLRDPLRIAAQSAPLRVEAVATAAREGAVANLLRLHQAPAAIVFCARREEAARLGARLAARGFETVTLSGALPQRERDAALAALRSGRARVCVATDVAARGLDLPGLDLVVHADLPANPAALAHRSGRTGRAGREGRAVLVVPHRLRGRVEALAAQAGVALDWSPAPGPDEILARDEARLVATLTEAAAPDPGERAAAARLLAAHDAERIAVALLRLHRPRPEPDALAPEPIPQAPAARDGRRSPPRRR